VGCGRARVVRVLSVGVRVLAAVLLVGAADVGVTPASAYADTAVACDTPALVAAINAAVAAGSGTLDLAAGCTYELTTTDPSGWGLPFITGNMTIHGNGATIERAADASQFGLIHVIDTLSIDHLTLTGGNIDTNVTGGGIFSIGTLTLTDTTVSDNTASGGYGGGIYNSGTATITDSTVAGNTASSGSGGGIGNDGTLTLTNSTVSGNGGGIENNGALTAASSIVADNSGGNCGEISGSITSGGYNLDSDGTCGLTAATDQNNVDPLLGPLQGNGGSLETMAPASTSPAIDAIPKGVNGCGTTIATDERGVVRPQGAGCDIGAHETGDVAMQKFVATPKSVALGTKVIYTAKVVNAGIAPATGVSVVDTLPTGLSFVSAHTSLGNCSFAAPTLTCSIGNLPAAATTTIKLSVRVNALAGKKTPDTAAVSATTGDTILTNDMKTVKVKTV
jgi:uncharacterized repeat protein (TIGR01451 family)